MSANKVTVSPTTKTVTVSSAGTVGPQGTQGIQGVQGAQGTQGVQGNTGATGATGATGTAATIAIGTVTTLSAGASATVTNSGSSSAATFDFGIPQGATGQGTGDMNDVIDDTTPQLGGDLDVNGKDIVSVSNGDIELNPNGSGKVVFKGNATKGSGQFVLNCENNSHGIVIKGPPHSAAASYTLTLPNNDGDSGQFLKTDGSGNLSWSADNNTTYSVQDGELSQNNFTNADHTKLDGIAAGAEVNVQADWNESTNTSDAYIANKPTIPSGNQIIDWTASSAGTIHSSNYTNTTYSIQDGELSQNNFTNADHTKLDGIAAGAEVNVQADWNQSTNTHDAYIANKPTLSTVATSGSYNDLSNKPAIFTEAEAIALAIAL